MRTRHAVALFLIGPVFVIGCSQPPDLSDSQAPSEALSQATVAQAQAQARCSKDAIKPNGDGDGDQEGPGNKDDELLQSISFFTNTLVQIWCIDGTSRAEGFYVALLVDGVKDAPFRFVGKCAWPFGKNTPLTDPEVRGQPVPLKGTTYTSTDVSRPDKGYVGTGKVWKYTYDHATDTVTAEKLDKEGRSLFKKSIKAPRRPFKFSDLPSNPDPEECVDQLIVRRGRGRGEDRNRG